MTQFWLAGVVAIISLAAFAAWAAIAPNSLPTLPGVQPGPNAVCAGVGLPDSVIHGDPAHRDLVWLVTSDPLSGGSGRHLSVRWPAGFSARFTPNLELVDGNGQVVAREGDLPRRVGGAEQDDGRVIVWEFDGRSYACS